MKPQLITNQDFIIVGQQAWDVEIGSNCKNIALELSKHNRVLYVNPPLDRITQYRGRNDERVIKRMKLLQGEENNLVCINQNLWNLYPDCILESINWIKSHFLFDTFNRWNNAKYAKSIRKIIALLGFKDFILFNDNDIFRSLYLIDFLQPKTSIYYSRDYMLGVDYWKYHGKVYEPVIIRKNDLCLSNSTYLTEYCKKYNPQSYFIGQGCELELYQNIPAVKAADLPDNNKPMIGYSGVLWSLRLDIEILLHVAKVKPEWNIILIGPEDEDFKDSELHHLENVYFTGLKEASDLPVYINAMDVCINPQLINETTIGNYPRKIDEYLALGKPVVAGKTPAMEMFAAHTYLAENKEEFLQKIELALTENNQTKQQERIAFAQSHSWENCIQKMYDAILNLHPKFS
ncbi:MAG: glycosyltransferase family 1 protein [Sphingobacteriaceae bacterium]|nr:MAG: glycosyltransferase family 1 protein [Sphingobacteriaceae bacterium]